MFYSSELKGLFPFLTSKTKSVSQEVGGSRIALAPLRARHEVLAPAGLNITPSAGLHLGQQSHCSFGWIGGSGLSVRSWRRRADAGEMPAAGMPRLLLLIPVAWGSLKAKCPQSVIREEKELLTYYRPGDHLLGGVLSTTSVFFQPQPLTEPPSSRIAW